MNKADCFDLLVLKLGLLTYAQLHATPSNAATINLSRLIGTNSRVSFLWWPEAMGTPAGSRFGGAAAVRFKVIALARRDLCDNNTVLSDDGVIAHAVAHSSYFAGLWDLIEVQIGSVTRAMSQWTRGNFTYYLNIFPVLCQLVASAHKPKVARAMIYKLERLLFYNERHPDIITFFAANCMTLRETVIENWHSVLTHYVNRHVAVVTHDNYVKATCSAQQLRKLREELKGTLLNKKEELAERLGLLQRLENKALDQTNKDVAEFLEKPFREMIAQLVKDGRCSGKYADELWPRHDWQANGQAKLSAALEETEAFLANRDWMPAAAPVGLAAWLAHPKTTMPKVHNPECKRRGLLWTGLKANLSERIFAHVVAHPDGFVGADDGQKHEARPAGFIGDLPATSPLRCACSNESCAAARAAAAAAAATAVVPLAAVAVAPAAAADEGAESEMAD
jgi:hypothetical protein